VVCGELVVGRGTVNCVGLVGLSCGRSAWAFTWGSVRRFRGVVFGGWAGWIADGSVVDVVVGASVGEVVWVGVGCAWRRGGVCGLAAW